MIGRQFRGPPNSGNGGYVCGVLTKGVEGPATAVIRAIVPLDVELGFTTRDGVNVLTGDGDALIGQGGPSTQDLPEPPLVPTLEAAREAGERCLGLRERVHPACFTCGDQRDEGDGLRVFPGQLEGAEPGVVACVWTPHASFADAEGRVPAEIVWAALDCPGYFAWVETEGRHGALLGTMTGEVTALVKAGQPYVVLAWPIAKEGRKETAGVALIDSDGQVVARGHQVWITMQRPPIAAPATEAATA